ncbi:DUF2188 domain-containing protein [Phytomonospora endophytica]|uniref:DUF2188 domain-containing protein n=1 Tax=Phytomonospora endophytica TaxID=714109 RepID=A0A841FYM9_9ACTN|nr:DUF2188 domain-containing protein [Phytomonospora endophytica]MBB6038828.1 hypothetical protein [Phytomonospora endophytica]GIG68376.1 hypothetical protein Pen01_46710 [Phytomonospora endophytica]
MATREIHTMWSSDRGQWMNQREGASRVSGYFDRKEQAVTSAQTTARREGLEWIGHRKDGQINERNTYRADPNPPQG